jgi:hypothetical protein
VGKNHGKKIAVQIMQMRHAILLVSQQKATFFPPSRGFMSIGGFIEDDMRPVNPTHKILLGRE